MDEVEWRDKIAERRLMMKTPNIVDVLRVYGSQSRPLVVLTDDNKEFVAKPLRGSSPPNRYQLAADFVVGALGNLMTAPVAPVQLLRLHDTIIDVHQLGDCLPGFCHGSEIISHIFDSYEIQRVDQNRERFAKLALLYGWTQATDHQYMYQRSAPYHVYSADHGDFLTTSSPWTAGLLDPEFESPAQADDRIVSSVSLKKAELVSATGPLRRVTDQDITGILSALPEEWGITIQERNCLFAFLKRRKDRLQEVYS